MLKEWFLSFVLCLQFMKMEHTDANSRQLVTNIFERCNEQCAPFCNIGRWTWKNTWNTLLEGIEVSPGIVKRAWTKLSPPLFKMHSFTLGTMKLPNSKGAVLISPVSFWRLFRACNLHAWYCTHARFFIAYQSYNLSTSGIVYRRNFRIDFDVYNPCISNPN